ncbi:hypothetical protein ICN11_01790 [Polynucleobacter sp. 78F-HAINBA]|uniref:hypothetical protein n=1 Tax=Polynucleobacter sp. 78F-HAINBA TaxID=2689099 RepID=UPI001C0C5F1D|nr:hypothetical protein [Polynucleobacter sp. 78F-HAINBA]MBU3590753.1 hypothetical protein [Polynucleobacter sp. 78F-HAINBA]
MDKLPPILLTSSVTAMDQSVQLKDEKLRVFHTLESIQKWLDISPQNKYVLCDGSGFDFSLLVLERFPGANIECISFSNDPDLIRLHGKGYGEGEIIRYALEHSKTLLQSQWFVKCTAKLWVDNFLECIQSWNGHFVCQAFFSNVFSFKKSQLEYVDTRFYMIDKDFYVNHLSKAHIGIGGPSGIGIEERFLEMVTREKLSRFLFEIPPVVCGMGGGSGKYYKDSRVRRLKERFRAWLVSQNSEFKLLFYKH